VEEEEFDWQIDQEMPVEDKPVGFSCGASNAEVQMFLPRNCFWGNAHRIMGLLSNTLQC
jgi:hypothetical protein